MVGQSLGVPALGIDQMITFSALKKDSGLVYQRVFQGIGTNGKNSGRMDGVDEFLDFSLDLSSVPSGLQFQLVQIGFANTNSVTINDPDVLPEEEGTSYDPDLVITDFDGETTTFENIRNGSGMTVSAGVLDIDAGDVVLGGGSTGIFSFSQSELPRDFPFNGEPTDTRAVGYSLASITFDFVEVTATTPDGDYNDNGVIDLADYVVWRDNLGAAITLPGDTTGEATVGQAQYSLWKGNFSAGAGGLAASQIPEPSSAAILLGLVATIAMSARRRIE